MIENGYYAKPYIGVSVTDVSSETQSYGLPQGAAVRTITEGSPAEAAELKVNDIITHANGTQITGSSHLVSIISHCQPGDKLLLTVYRNGETLELTIVVGKQIQDTTANSQNRYR